MVEDKNIFYVLHLFFETVGRGYFKYCKKPLSSWLIPPVAFRKSTWEVRLCEHEILGSSISGAREAGCFNEQSALPQKATPGRGIAKCARRRGGKPLPQWPAGAPRCVGSRGSARNVTSSTCSSKTQVNAMFFRAKWLPPGHFFLRTVNTVNQKLQNVEFVQ